ncbi:MAG: Enterobactin exporter EntS [Elusimicrobia bacterium]|nr:Enterobactin exporter EntS [Elusimicrobiota bacterium]
MFRALKSRNFRIYFIGQGVSLIGTWMQQIAMSWLVYRLTHSAFLLGLVSFTNQIPTLFFSPFAGVLADKLNRRRVVLVTQTLLMLQAGTLFYLTYTNTVKVWNIVLLGLFFGFINAIDIPTRQSFVIELIPSKEELGNAIALNAAVVNLTRLIGPAIGGLMVVAVGEAWCFLFNAASFMAVLIALLFLRTAAVSKPLVRSELLKNLKEGFDYAFKSKEIAPVLFLLGIIALAGTPYSVLMPLFASDTFHGNADTLGFLSAASGFGALAGSIYLTLRKRPNGSKRLIAFHAALFGLSLILFSFTKTLESAFLLLFIGGFGIMVMMGAANTFLQIVSEDDKRGRVMSFYVMMFMGVNPMGGFLAGVVASHVAAPATVRLGGIICLLGALIFGRRFLVQILRN